MDKRPIGDLPDKIKVVLIALICSCLLSTVRIIRSAPRLGSLTRDDISRRSDRRFAAIKQVLPSRGAVGYVGEQGGSSLPDYYLAQYALAPLIVDWSTDHRFVMGNFPSGQVPASLPGLKKIGDFGNGVILLSNEAAP